ncbi:uncharacterized protein KQ657_003011 [Scheffersomyces spartinae]|uniref:methylated diphthine methylhydrolase n=1 Tax=Scheffersomyces spartinae TaxID=45513 RepID=A0A9P7V593_9ASCO|nr:uncharacterized protein KQ657_003011 [Scheffersomyces spartinae]KAG7191616.1 hypothetical protein KQ657_003011 [Scheffersomyces spartinae]
MSDLPTCTRLDIVHSELPPCCIRYHPLDQDTFVVGTYKLETGDLRHGSLEVYCTTNGKNPVRITSLATESAILDIKFNREGTRLVSAHSTGEIRVWNSEDPKQLHQLIKHQIFDEKTLITSVFFSEINHMTLLVTATSGEAGLFRLETGTWEPFDTCHDLECWSGEFGCLDPLTNVVFTGGDDAKLIAHDTRTREPIWTSTRNHNAGVVSVLTPRALWNTNKTQIWTGSYDDHIRALDIRMMGTQLYPAPPKTVLEENLGGGVWRLIPNPKKDGKVLACCMYDGARVLELTKDQSRPFEATKYFIGDHKSMCYGGDWSADGERIITCSFYDNVIQIWSP